jgi:two-component SAPR family response regulator
MSFAGKRVLILEDEYFIASDLSEALQRAGAEIVGPFNRPNAALAAIEAYPPDSAIVDINLAGERGFDVADALAARQVPFVIASGYDRTSVPARHADAPFCQKPVTTRDLLQVLARSSIGI